MTALYNEIDKNAAAWLRQLISAGLIAPGVVDERDIRDLEPDYVATFTQFHAFAGIGVWSHALRLAGWPDDRPVWTGSCPCQPFSAAGKGGGFDDERHLWPAFHHLIAQCRPDVVLGEQVASKDGLAWLDLVHADLEGAGYAVGAADTCAAGFGAPHIRQRLWWVGTRLEHAARDGRFERRAEPGGRSAAGGCSDGVIADASGQGLERRDPGALGDQCAAVERSGCAEWLAQPHNPIGRAVASAGDDDRGHDAGRPQGAGHAEAGRGLCGLANAEGHRHERRGQLDQSAGRDGAAHGGPRNDLGLDRPDPAHDHAVLAPAAAHPHGLVDDNGDWTQRTLPGVHLVGHAQPDGGPVRSGPTGGFWAAPDWLQCRDGRWRAVEPGTFPLAHGAPARVGRLRGYGNAIVAQAAQGFVASVMEAAS